MYVVAGVAKFEPVALALMHGELRGHSLHGEGLAVESPLVKSVQRTVMLDDEHFDRFVRRSGSCPRFGEDRVVPTVRLWLGPLRLAAASGVFDDDAHAVAAVVIREVAR